SHNPNCWHKASTAGSPPCTLWDLLATNSRRNLGERFVRARMPHGYKIPQKTHSKKLRPPVRFSLTSLRIGAVLHHGWPALRNVKCRPAPVRIRALPRSAIRINEGLTDGVLGFVADFQHSIVNTLK